MAEYWIFIASLIAMILVVSKFIRNHFVDSAPEPPHPFAWPLVGNYLQFTRNGQPSYEYLRKLSRRYGGIFRIKLGSQKVLVLSDYDVVKEAFAGPAMAGRPDWLSMTVQSESPYHFAFRGYGPEWKFLRKTSVKALTTLKTSESSRIENHCRTALGPLLATFREAEGRPLDPATALFRCVCTVMGVLAFGQSFDADDPNLNRILNCALDTSRLTKVGSCTDTFPWTAGLFRNLIQSLRTQSAVFDEYVVATIKLREANARAVTNLADALHQLADRYPTDSEQHQTCRFVAIDLFGAGFFTTMTNLEWALLILAKLPDVQRRMRREIFSRCCDGEFVAWRQRRDLAYSEAVLYEVLRYCTVLPYGVPRAATVDSELSGFRVAAKTPVLANLWAVHRDERKFAEPDRFDPDRFLTPDRSALDPSATANVLSFSTGLRRCPGEFVAKQNLFLILTNIVKSFEMTLASDYANLDRCEMNFSRKPLPYRLRFAAVEKYDT